MTMGMSVALKMTCCSAGHVLPRACSCDMLLKRWDTVKRLVGAVLVLTLILPVVPVLAGDTFHALSRLPAGLSPLDDAQLAAIEGGQERVTQSNTAIVTVTQSNSSTITGSIVGDVNVTQNNNSTVQITQQNSAN